jgi:hypothetical protein
MNWRLFLGSVLLLVSGTLHLAHAAAIMNVVEVDGNVVATTTGTIDMSGMELLLGPLGASGLFQGDYPGGSALITGSTEMEIGAGYGITWSDPPFEISSSGMILADFGSGVVLGVFGGNRMFLPNSYVSGTPIDSVAIWYNKTFEDLGMNVGSYVFTWGSGENADSLTINIGTSSNPAAVPEPATTALLSMGALGMFLFRRLRRA